MRLLWEGRNEAERKAGTSPTVKSSILAQEKCGVFGNVDACSVFRAVFWGAGPSGRLAGKTAPVRNN